MTATAAVRNSTGNSRPTGSTRLTSAPWLDRRPPAVQPQERQQRHQSEQDLPRHRREPPPARPQAVMGPHPQRRDHAADDDGGDREGAGARPRRVAQGGRLDRGRRPHPGDGQLAEGDAGGGARHQREGQLEHRLEARAAPGDTPRTVSSVTSRRLRSNHNRRGGGHQRHAGERGEGGDRPDARADRRLDRARSGPRRRAGATRDRTETSSASSRASMPPSPATRPKLVGMRGGPSAHHDKAGGVIGAAGRASSIRPSARSTVTPSRSGASQRPAAYAHPLRSA